MKTLLLTLAIATTCFGQAVRFDSEVTTVNASCMSGKQCPLLALPGSSISVCQGSPATKALCQASPATTYTAAGAGTSCSTLAQLTPATGGACRSTADNQGNWGMWVLPGSYSYYITVPSTAGGGTTGPYPLSIQGAAGGYVLDSLYATIAEACTAAGTGTLYLTTAWNGLTTQTLGCNIYAMANGKLRPASGQVVTISGTFDGVLTQHFDLSLSGYTGLSVTGPVVAFYPQWFGAACANSGDDTVAMQNAIVSAGGKTLTISGLCRISSALYIPTTATGAIIRADSLKDGSGIVAISGSAPFVMIKNYAARVLLENLVLGCNNTATVGLLQNMALLGTVRNVRVEDCLSDGTQVNIHGGPTTVSTTQINAGATAGSTVTLAQAVQAGVTLGDPPGCPYILWEYGTVRQEFLSYTRVGNVLTQTSILGNAAYTHPIGSNARCNANDNAIIFDNLQGYRNDGWGLNVFPGSDNNTLVMRDLLMSGNTLGGILLAGSKHTMYGGFSEGNSGPAVQLGDLNGGSPVNGTNGRTVYYSTIFPLTDLENQAAAYNAVTSVCGVGNTIYFNFPTDFILKGAGAACTGLSGGVSDLGIGGAANFNGFTVFDIKNTGGSTLIDNSAGTVAFYDTSDVFRFSLGPLTQNRLMDTGTVLNNLIVTSGAPLVEGLRISVYTAVALTGGASNTITYNGATKTIVSNLNYGNLIGTGYRAGSTIDLLFSNGNFQAMGQ